MAVPRDVQRCARCRAPIVWAVTEHRRRQALDAVPNPAGNTAVYRDGLDRLRARGISQERPLLEHVEVLYMPHAATCRNPRRRKPR